MNRYELLALTHVSMGTWNGDDYMNGSSGNSVFTELLQRFQRQRHWRTLQITKLPSYRFNLENSQNNQTFCTVCLEDFELNQTVRKLICSHEFHTHCVDKWLESTPTCPLCRAPLDELKNEFPNIALYYNTDNLQLHN
uniref:RING-type domain-containing protein n=1 Tax=Glossina brevipalpis TaxID=37001 RepID=A0A1A9WHL4_9MUSC